MINPNEKPKRKNPIIWILVAFSAFAVFFSIMRGCGDTSSNIAIGSVSDEELSKTATDHDSVDINAPVMRYEEVTDTGIEIRGDKTFNIYTISESKLFQSEDSKILDSAIPLLEQVGAALEKHSANAEVVIYGNTDSTNTDVIYRNVGANRADAVKNWLVDKAGVPSASISVDLRGFPSAKIDTAKATDPGHKKNLRIVAYLKEGDEANREGGKP